MTVPESLWPRRRRPKDREESLLKVEAMLDRVIKQLERTPCATVMDGEELRDRAKAAEELKENVRRTRRWPLRDFVSK